MIPTLMVIGLILGLIPALRLRYTAVVTVVIAIGWAALVAFGDDGSFGPVFLGFALAMANTALGIAIGMGVVALIRLSRPSKPRQRRGTA